jgi:predicted P-loop ATPase
MPVKFEEIAPLALARATELLPRWLGGKKRGSEWVGERRANGGLGDSWSVSLESGAWLHGSGDERGGDLISLYAALNNLSQVESLHAVAGLIGAISDYPVESKTNGQHPSPDYEPEPVKPPEMVAEPIPSEPPPVPDHPRHGPASALYKYGTAFWVARYDLPDGKQFCPLTWRGGKWAFKGLPDKRPLFWADILPILPNSPVLVVEGEKCALAASKVMLAYAVVTWSSGASAYKRTDWEPLRGRRVVIWPDADEPGWKAAAAIAQHLSTRAESVKVIDTHGQPEGWDIADAIAEGWDGKRITEWAKARVTTVSEPPQEHVKDDMVPLAALEYEQSQPVKTKESDKSEPLMVEESTMVNWQSLGLDCNEGGVPHPTLANASIIIRAHKYLAGKIWFDTFKKKIFHNTNGPTREWDDADDLKLTAWIQQQLRLPKMYLSTIQQAVVHASHINARNSLTDWLDSLVWDGVSRLDTWLSDCLGVPRSEYTDAVARNWPIAMVARAYRPGCQVDNMPVLEGKMGRGKSKVLAALGGEWYSSVTEAFGSKDFLQAIQGQWLIEVPDMTGFNKRENSMILSTITIRTDRYRASYGRHTNDHPRTCMFSATSETDDYLQNTLGRRRYWPLRCTSIDVDALLAQREQIFAEAVVKFRSGATWHEVPESADVEQMDRATPDLWNDKIMMFAENWWKDHTVPITSANLLKYAIEMPLDRQGDAEKKRIARIMRDNGWITARDMNHRFWRKR